jgi:predicted RNase H-like HicB family nuclease
VKYAVVVGRDPLTGNYFATSPDTGDDVVGIGATDREATDRFRNALLGYLESKRRRGTPIPKPRHTVAMVDITPTLSS